MLYRQPSPFATNQYWAEEITMGPGPPPKRASKKARAARELYLRQEPKPVLEAVNITERLGPNGVHKGLLDDTARKSLDLGDRWNKKRYQREDEELWGLEEEEEYPAIEGTIRNRSVRGLSTDTHSTFRKPNPGTSTESFYVVKNPPVNDLHPPVVSNPSSTKANNQWMLQPPPSAKIMNGYEQVNRSRSGSGTSSRKGGELALSRKLSHRIVAEQARKVEMSYFDSMSKNPKGKENSSEFTHGFVPATHTSAKAYRKRDGTGSSTTSTLTMPTTKHGQDLSDSGVDLQDAAARMHWHEPDRNSGLDFYDYAYSKNKPIMLPFVRTKTIAATPNSLQSLKRLSRTRTLGDLESDKTETRRPSAHAHDGLQFLDTLHPNAPDLDATANNFLAGAEGWTKQLNDVQAGARHTALSSAKTPASSWDTDWYLMLDHHEANNSRDWPTARAFRRWSADF